MGRTSVERFERASKGFESEAEELVRGARKSGKGRGMRSSRVSWC